MIHIACCIDSNFTVHCAVTLVSVFENNPDNKFCVHIVAPSMPEKDQKSLKNLAGKYDNEVIFYFPPKNTLDSFYVKGSKRRFTSVIYYRCLLGDILPADLDKVLYLDCDIIVMDDLSEFWNIDIDKYAVACVEASFADRDDLYTRLQYDKKYSYFNAGILLINLKYWRDHYISDQCKEYFGKYPERIVMDDQDLLNVLLFDKKLFVPMKWNMQEGFYRYRMEKKVENLTEWKKALLNPSILHYTIKKPWWYDCYHPLRGEYFKYLQMTEWKDCRPSDTLRNRIARELKRMTYTLKLRKPRFMKL